MKVKVNRDACIGCGACAAICPDVFEIDDEGLSKVVNSDVKDENIDDVKDAIDSCPTGAIEEDEKPNKIVNSDVKDKILMMLKMLLKKTNKTQGNPYPESYFFLAL